MDSSLKMTENEVIEKLIVYLENERRHIGDNYCLGAKHGVDIKALKDGKTLFVEAKGAAADKDSAIKKRGFFDSGQINSHFGKAIVQVLKYKAEYPDHQHAIAHPDDSDIKKHTGKLIPFLKQIDIIHFWVSPDSKVIHS